jgi:hypothetical protein
MVISLIGSPGKPLTIEPDPAYVRVGSTVEWRLSFDENYPHAVEWTVYFGRATPFTEKAWKAVTGRQTVPPSPARHEEYIAAGTANESGEYKYGVRTINANTGETLSDDDPILIVTQ